MLTETGTIYRPISEHTFNETTGLDRQTYITVGTVPVHITPEASEEVNIGAATHTRGRYDVTFHSDADVALHDEVVIGDQRIKITDAPLDPWAVARLCKGDVVGTGPP